MPNNRFSKFDFPRIQHMYDSKVAELMDQIGQGKPWEDTEELRSSLSQLSAIIYDKVQKDTVPLSFPSVAC